jgi:hypothetical protein
MATSEHETHTPEERAANGAPAGIEEEAITPFPFDAEKISISNQVLSIETLVRRLNQGTIYPPRIQRRGNLWNPGRQSRLVESMMLRIPLPLFYVAADDDDNWNVVDGLQRLTTIEHYIRKQDFALCELEFMREYEGKKFDALPQKMQNRIFETQLSMAIINPSTPPEVQRNVFKRLNTGGLPLSAQEIRHALYFGFSAELLEELVNSEWFQKATNNSVNDTRMGGREMILRFLAFFLRGDQYPKNEDMDTFLSETMQLLNLMPEWLPQEKLHKIFGEKYTQIQVASTDVEEIKRFFYLAMERAYNLFGIFAFRKSPPGMSHRTPINKSLFEAWSVVLAKMSEDNFQALVENKEILAQKMRREIYESDSVFENSISRDSHKLSGVKKRYEILQQIVQDTILEKG